MYELIAAELRPAPPALFLDYGLNEGASILSETSWKTGLLVIRRPRLGLTVPPVLRDADVVLSWREEWW